MNRYLNGGTQLQTERNSGIHTTNHWYEYECEQHFSIIFQPKSKLLLCYTNLNYYLLQNMSSSNLGWKILLLSSKQKKIKDYFINFNSSLLEKANSKWLTTFWVGLGHHNVPYPTFNCDPNQKKKILVFWIYIWHPWFPGSTNVITWTYQLTSATCDMKNMYIFMCTEEKLYASIFLV